MWPAVLLGTRICIFPSHLAAIFVRRRYGAGKRRGRGELEGIPRLRRWWNFVLGLFIRFYSANMALFWLSQSDSFWLLLSLPFLSHSLCASNSTLYNRTDVIFFINHRRKTDSSDVAGPENSEPAIFGHFSLSLTLICLSRSSAWLELRSFFFFRLEYEGRRRQPFPPATLFFLWHTFPPPPPSSHPFQDCAKNKRRGRRARTHEIWLSFIRFSARKSKLKKRKICSLFADGWRGGSSLHENVYRIFVKLLPSFFKFHTISFNLAERVAHKYTGYQIFCYPKIDKWVFGRSSVKCFSVRCTVFRLEDTIWPLKWEFCTCIRRLIL